MDKYEERMEGELLPAEVIAKIGGEPLTEVPKDLYIPPDALKVFLEQFEGPLDLLLYLIRRQNIDILDIPIETITRQYAEYIEVMRELQLDLAAEYLAMAAMLAEIKSRMLLPRPATTEEEEADPRVALVKRLQEYERFKEAAMALDELPRLERDIYLPNIEVPKIECKQPEPEVSLEQLFVAFEDLLKRVDLTTSHQISREMLSVRAKMTWLLDYLSEETLSPFSELFDLKEGKMGIVVTFIALLELIRQSLLKFVQRESFAPIYVGKVKVEVNEHECNSES